MGNYIQKLFSSFVGKREVRVVMVGLDGAGKTTVLFQLKLGEIVTTIPTIGFNVETLEFMNVKFNVWDVGGQDKIRKMWKHYYPNTDGIIFVVDSSDAARIHLAAEELQRMLAEEDLRDSVLLVMANKQDIAVMSVDEIIDKLGLRDMKNRVWFCQGTSATKSTGLTQGLQWLHKQLTQKR